MFRCPARQASSAFTIRSRVEIQTSALFVNSQPHRMHFQEGCSQGPPCLLLRGPNTSQAALPSNNGFKESLRYKGLLPGPSVCWSRMHRSLPLRIYLLCPHTCPPPAFRPSSMHLWEHGRHGSP